MKCFFLIFITVFLSSNLHGQEFPKGWVLYGETTSGMSTAFNSTPDLFTGSIGFLPQYAIDTNHIRLSLAVAAAYTNKRVSGLLGGGVNVRLLTLKAGSLGSLGNLQLQLQYLFGTDHQRLVGGGPKLEIGQIISLSLTALRDYKLKNWWLQTGIGYNFLHKQKKKKSLENILD